MLGPVQQNAFFAPLWQQYGNDREGAPFGQLSIGLVVVGALQVGFM
jgi:hypothetical protein